MSTQFNNNTIELQELLDIANSLPDNLNTATNNPATSSDILNGKIAWANDKQVIGDMPNNGAISHTIDGVNTKSIVIPEGYTSGGSVSLDDTIDNATAAIISAITKKGVTVPSDAELPDLGALIAAIEVGEGNNVVIGEFTLTANDTIVNIRHGLGDVPRVMMMWLADAPTTSTSRELVCGGLVIRAPSSATTTGTIKDYSFLVYTTNTSAALAFSANTSTGAITGKTLVTATDEISHYRAKDFDRFSSIEFNKNYFACTAVTSTAGVAHFRTDRTYRWLIA